MCGCSHAPPTGYPARNPGMRPNWESNWRPFASKAGAQSTEPHQLGPLSIHFNARFFFHLATRVKCYNELIRAICLLR